MKINIKKLGGEIDLSSPSLATCFEFVSLWSAETDNAMLARLCAGSIGVCIDHTARLPKYRPNKYRASDIYEEGIKCLSFMSTKIPTEQEVDERANFSSTPEQDISTD